MRRSTAALSLAVALLALVALITGCGAATTATRTVTTYRTTTAASATPARAARRRGAIRCTEVARAAAACGTLAQQFAARVALHDPPFGQTFTASSTTSSASTAPTATYCEDGTCTTVRCPPANPTENWICATSSSPAARAAVHAPPPGCPVGEVNGLGVGTSRRCYPSPNQCIAIPADMTGGTANGPRCPDGEITRGQAVYLQECYGNQINGRVQWAGCDEAPSPVATFGLPCELLVNLSTMSYMGPYSPFYSGTSRAVYAPNASGALTFWTPTCPHSNGS